MTVALYADYIADLRALFSELDRQPERFQTVDVHLELAAAGGLIVYETKRRKGQTDALYYGRPADGGANRQVSQATAFAAIDRFFALDQFIALTGDRSGAGMVDPRYPHCAVHFSYRKKGQPVARAMLMVFVGFNDATDALAFVSQDGDSSAYVAERPYYGTRAYEWK